VVVPVPVNGTVCGLPGTPSATLTAAVRVPDAVGVKVTVNVQLVFAARLDPQAFAGAGTAKSPGLVPVNVMPAMLSAALPLFVSVTVWAVLVVPIVSLANVRRMGESGTSRNQGAALGSVFRKFSRNSLILFSPPGSAGWVPSDCKSSQLQVVPSWRASKPLAQ
jgi:hypothetical protein